LAFYTFAIVVTSGLECRVIFSLLRMLLAFAAACLVAALAQVTYALTPGALGAEPHGSVELVLLTATHFAVFSSPFALVTAAFGEWQSIRSWLYYAVAGIGIAMAGFLAQYSSEGGGPTILNAYAIKAFLSPGFIAGFVYWIVAGRHAGDDPDALRIRTAAKGP
jgi:hypothetical protein